MDDKNFQLTRIQKFVLCIAVVNLLFILARILSKRFFQVSLPGWFDALTPVFWGIMFLGLLVNAIQSQQAIRFPRVQFSLGGLFISLLALNLSLALWLGTQNEYSRATGMAGVAVWCVTMAVWTVSKLIDADAAMTRDKQNHD